MPQATEELRKRWDGPSEFKAMDHLHKRGFKLTPQWEWVPPMASEPTEEDLSAILFLIQEWDFGGLVE